jgi:8-oxo-dGTP diphosphatase
VLPIGIPAFVRHPGKMPYTSPVDVMLMYRRGGEVLLARRHNTGYADGLWNLPSGKLEEGEDVVSAIRREAREEIDVDLTGPELRDSAVVHWLSPEGNGRLGVVFSVEADPVAHGEPRNAEPEKCSDLAWFRFIDLPDDTVEYSVAGIRAHVGRRPVVTTGWKR